MPKLTFPEDFVWGAATAAYQIEGAPDADGKGPSIWDTFTRKPGAIANGDTGDIACDHYHRYEEDIRLMKDLNLNTYRFSLSWPRIFPDDTGNPNKKGISFYKKLISRLRDEGITPAVTLYHWDLPQELDDAGGWLSRDTVDAFVVYATRMAQEFGADVDMWTTFNEPWVSSFVGYGAGAHAPGHADDAEALTAAHHLNLAHARAYKAIKAVAPLVDAMIVVGSPHSSNSQRLVEVALRNGCKVATLVDRASEIDWSLYGDITSLGVSAGASAPENLVEEVIDPFAARYDVTVETKTTAEENIAFNIPRVLRNLEAAAGR